MTRLNRIQKTILSLLLFIGAGTTLAASCLENPYFPVVEGQSLSYNNESSEKFMTQTITSVASDSFTMHMDLHDIGESAEAEYLCTDEGILAVDLGSMMNTLDMDIDVNFEIISMEGATFPNVWDEGHTWDSEVVMEMKMTVEGMPVDSVITVNTTSTIVGTEDVSVPAGDFSTVHIASNADVSMSMSMMGMEMPLPGMETRSDAYLADGVGMVLNTDEDGGRMELVDYTAP
ncbi:MAG TPA: hypothetical protein VK092_05605 [Deinococcales bacterium]|nr:hypothetical protein [Deinococcales bacterium]